MSYASLLNQTGTIANRSTTDRHGKYSYGSATSVRMRFQKTSKVINTVNNDKEPIDGIVFLPPTTTVDKGDKLVFGGVNYKVMTVSPIILGNGQTHHIEVMVQEKNV